MATQRLLIFTPISFSFSLQNNRLRPQDVAPCLYLMSMTFVAHCFVWPCPRVLAVNKPLTMRRVFGGRAMLPTSFGCLLAGNGLVRFMMWPCSSLPEKIQYDEIILVQLRGSTTNQYVANLFLANACQSMV